MNLEDRLLGKITDNHGNAVGVFEKIVTDKIGEVHAKACFRMGIVYQSLPFPILSKWSELKDIFKATGHTKRLKFKNGKYKLV